MAVAKRAGEAVTAFSPDPGLASWTQPPARGRHNRAFVLLQRPDPSGAGRKSGGEANVAGEGYRAALAALPVASLSGARRQRSPRGRPGRRRGDYGCRAGLCQSGANDNRHRCLRCDGALQFSKIAKGRGANGLFAGHGYAGLPAIV